MKLEYYSKRLPFLIHSHRIIKNHYIIKITNIVCSPLAKLYYKYKYNKYKNYRGSKDKFSIVAIFKNEADYLKEWIEYHKYIGFNKFYLYNNESTDNYKDILSSYVEENIVVLKNMKGKKRQLDAYNDAINKYADKTDYLAILDIDEYVYFEENFNLEYLESLLVKDEVGAIGIHWKIFGSSGIKNKTPGLITQKYLYSSEKNFDVNRHIKSIVNPRKVICINNPHFPSMSKNFSVVNENGEKIYGPIVENIAMDKVRINHYFTKSYEEFLAKRARGMADNLNIRDIKEFEGHDKNDIYDEGMLKFKDVLQEEI